MLVKEKLNERQKSFSRRDFLKIAGGAGIAGAVFATTTAMTEVPGSNQDMIGSRLKDPYLPQYPSDYPWWVKEIDDTPNSLGTTEIVPSELVLGATKIYGKYQAFTDGRQDGFQAVGNAVTNQDWTGEWGQIAKDAVDNKNKWLATLTPDQMYDYRFGTAMVMASDHWHVNTSENNWIKLPVAATKVELSAEEMTIKLKNVAHWFGVDQARVCAIDDKMKPFFYKIAATSGTLRGYRPKGWVDPGRPVAWPYPYKYAIVMSIFVSLPTHRAGVGPLANASTATTCSDQDVFAKYMESTIRGLGYEAYGMIIADEDCCETPFAVRAGLAEAGRIGLAIAPWGAGLRTVIVVTNAPLMPDKPIDFGLLEFCKVCGRCSKNCVAQVIGNDAEPTLINGSYKWEYDGLKCMQQRTSYGCQFCVSVCPWSAPNTPAHDFGRFFASIPALAPAMVKIAEMSYGEYPRGKDAPPWQPWHSSDEWAPWRA
ncbi:twin-arginine translocation signal domain-containing protein [Dehalogenimonas etheniformans]|nr:reductive dehalogenase domain-containing protein [Dehalogenimonas etheniformans]QNT75906.1 twin-arginine translocation signal domain-containing protein [Dehalogenimonas etheniformans]